MCLLYKLGGCSSAVWLILFILYPSSSAAQIIPDNTLGNEGSIVLLDQVLPDQTGEERSLDLIQGGAIRGSNLFHSFLEFNVNNGQRVYFNNPGEIDRILMRVTGQNLSAIEGTLGVLGNADLFVLNPNGLAFGPNARLDIPGSFVGTTAASLRFNGFEFSATNPTTPPLLTLTVPLGLQYGQTPGLIQATGPGNHASGRPTSITTIQTQGGLAIDPGKTLALLGGAIDLEGVALQGGQVALFGEMGPGEIVLGWDDRGWQFTPENLIPLPIALTGGSVVNAYDRLNLYGSDLTLTDQSLILGQVTEIPSLGIGESWENLENREIYLNVRDRLDLSDRSAILTEATATAEGLPLRIEAGSIQLQEDARISSLTSGSGRSGTITLTTTDRLYIQGQSSQPGVTTQIRSSTLGGGDAGNIAITSPLITISDGGYITSTSVPPGTGNAGEIQIQADEVQVNGFGPTTFLPSAIRSAALSSGNAGTVNIESDRVFVTQGGRITALTANSGDAGEVKISASQFIQVEGRSANTDPRLNSSRISAAATPLDRITQQAFALPEVPTGNSGSLTLTAPEIRVQDGGLITTNNEGTGDAGVLSIVSDRLRVENGGQITSTVLRGKGGSITMAVEDLSLKDSSINTSVLEQGAGGSIAITAQRLLLNNAQIFTNTVGTDPGGNIQLTIGELLVLRQGSTIAANATGTEAGGNIQIQTPLLVALENSDITANATNNRGGTQTIRTQVILGAAVRPALTTLSDITASSDLGTQLSGTVTLSTPELDVSSGLVVIDPSPIDPSQQLATGCNRYASNRFSWVGKGGLPENPIQSVENPTLLADIRLRFTLPSVSHRPHRHTDQALTDQALGRSIHRKPLREAVNWFQDNQGHIHLVGTATVGRATVGTVTVGTVAVNLLSGNVLSHQFQNFCSLSHSP